GFALPTLGPRLRAVAPDPGRVAFRRLRLPVPASAHRPPHRQFMTSTTVTVTGSSGVEGRWRGVQDGADAVPETLLTPTLIPAVGGVPGAVAWRQFAPRDAVVHDPKQALEQTPVVQGRAATGRLLRGQERRDLLPEGVAERRGPGEPSG